MDTAQRKIRRAIIMTRSDSSQQYSDKNVLNIYEFYIKENFHVVLIKLREFYPVSIFKRNEDVYKRRKKQKNFHTYNIQCEKRSHKKTH